MKQDIRSKFEKNTSTEFTWEFIEEVLKLFEDITKTETGKRYTLERGVVPK